MSFRWHLAQFLEIRWWHRYLRTKDKTAYLRWKTNYWHHFLEKSGLAIPEQAVWLDAGCGPAGIFILSEGAAIDALDPLLARYERRLPHFQRSDYPRVRFFETPLETFVSDRPCYDLVFCLNAINHVADLERSMDRLVALTRPGGTLVMSVDAHNHALLKKLFRMLPGDMLHPHQHDVADYTSLLTRRGCLLQRTMLHKKEWIFSYYVLVATKD